jgi:hypothetical protein
MLEVKRLGCRSAIEPREAENMKSRRVESMIGCLKGAVRLTAPFWGNVVSVLKK